MFQQVNTLGRCVVAVSLSVFYSGSSNYQGPGAGHGQRDCVWWTESPAACDAVRITRHRGQNGPAVQTRRAWQIHSHQI